MNFPKVRFKQKNEVWKMRPIDILRAQAKFENPRQGFFPGPKPDIETIIQDSYRTDLPNTLNKARYTYINGKITKKKQALYKITPNERVLQDAIDAFTPEAAIQSMSSGPFIAPIGPGGPNVLNDYSKLRALDNQKIVNEYLQKTAREKQAKLDDDRAKREVKLLNKMLVEQFGSLKKINKAISKDQIQHRRQMTNRTIQQNINNQDVNTQRVQDSLGNIITSIEDQTRLLEIDRENLIQEIRNTYRAINDLNQNLTEQQRQLLDQPPPEFLMTPVPQDQPQEQLTDQLDSDIANYTDSLKPGLDFDPESDLETVTRTDNQPPIIPQNLYIQQLYLVPVKNAKDADFVKLKDGQSINAGKYLPFSPDDKKFKTGFEQKSTTRSIDNKADKYYRLERKVDLSSLNSNVLPVTQLIDRNLFYSDKPVDRDKFFETSYNDFAREYLSGPK